MAQVIVNKSKPIDVNIRPHLGYQYEKNGAIYGDKRCDYCGKWFTWSTKQKNKHIENYNWKVEPGRPVMRKVTDFKYVKDYLSVNEEPIHCGSSHCQEYHRRVLAHEKRLAERNTDYYQGLFSKLKKRKIII